MKLFQNISKATKHIFFSLISFALLSGCSTLSETFEEVPTLTCPTFFVLDGADKLVRYLPNSENDVTDTLLRANLRFSEGECSISDQTLFLEFPVIIDSEKGPALKANTPIEIEFFIAVLDQDKNILTRDNIIISIAFEPLVSSQLVSRFVEYSFPLKGLLPKDYSIYLGFVLTREEFNKIQRNR